VVFESGRGGTGDDGDDRRLRLNKYEDELTIVGVRRSDASTYSCRAFNSVGADTRTYTLLVQGPSYIVRLTRKYMAKPCPSAHPQRTLFNKPDY